MKQLIIGKKVAYASSAVSTNISGIADGAIAIFNLITGETVTTAAKLNNNFSVVCGRGTDKMPFMVPEVDVKTLSIVKSEYAAGATFTAKITVPTPEKGKPYTVIVVRKGTVFNERSNWSFTAVAKDTTAANVAKAITEQINANTGNLGVSATYSGGAITITAKKAGNNYEVIGADELTGVEPTSVTQGKLAVLDKAYVADLSSRCRAGKGFQHSDMKEPWSIYPGWPEEIDSDQYVMYTLRFAVPRVASKQRDEVVYQLLHIVVPVGAAQITTLDTIFGLTTPSGD